MTATTTTTTYYKATRPDGTDFRTGTVQYAALCGTGESLPELPERRDGDYRLCSEDVYHASTVPTMTLLGGSWPCRLFEVEGNPVVGPDDHDLKAGFRTLRVLRELPAHEALGPQGEEVAAMIDRAANLTKEEIARVAALGAAWDAAREAALGAAREAALGAAWDAAREAAWVAAWHAAWHATRTVARTVARGAAREAALVAVRGAATALVVRDLISAERFEALYGPWRRAIGGSA